MFSGRKKSKNFPAKTKLAGACQLRDACQKGLKHWDWNNGVGVPKFCANLDFENFENETPNKRFKKMSEEELDKSGEDQKSINTSRSTQFALRTWQAWLEQGEFVESLQVPESTSSGQ